MSRLRWSDNNDPDGFINSDSYQSRSGRYSSARSSESRYRYNGYQENSYQTNSGSSSSWRTMSNESPRYHYSQPRTRSWKDESPRQEFYSSSTSRHQYGYSQQRDYTSMRHRSSSGSSGRDYSDLIQHSAPYSSRGLSDHHSMLVKPSQPQSYSFSNFTNINANSRSMSHSFLDQYDPSEEMLSNHTPVMERGRLRNQSLTYGVSEADLERATRTVLSDHTDVVQAPFSLQMPVRKEGRGKFNQARHSLPDLFQGLNNPKPSFVNQNTPDSSDMMQMQQTKISSSQVASSSTISNQVTFQSPIIVPPTPVSVPSSMYSPAPTTTSFSAKPVLTSFKDSEAQDNCSKEDETLKMLQRHYLQAILTLAPPHKLSEASNTIKNQAQAQALAAKEESLSQPQATPTVSAEEASVNPPAKILDSILKLWEESQAENSRLRQDMAAMRLELEATKQQLENAFQANSSVSDADKEERKAMERKLEEMEEKLQSITSNNVTDGESDLNVSKLKEDNSRLREENAGLIKVMTKLSDNKK